MKLKPTTAHLKGSFAIVSLLMFTSGCKFDVNGLAQNSLGQTTQPTAFPSPAPSPSQSSQASQTVTSIQVIPAQIIIASGGTQQFSATAFDQSGSSLNVQPKFSWTVSGGGSISPSGLFTAGNSVGGPFTITAAPPSSPLKGTASVSLAAPVTGCSSTAGVKTWEKVTASPLAAISAENFGYALDTRNPGTIYLGTIVQGIWKTTDCGAHWAGPINTGTSGTDASNPSVPVLGSVLSGNGSNGMNWSMAIDPSNSDIYTVVGYGANGLYKSLDGGVNWNQLLPASLRAITSNGFVNHISMDPTNPQHLVIDFHALGCGGTALPGAQLVSQDNSSATVVSLTASTPTGTGTAYSGWGCLAETSDGGNTWSLTTAGYPDINGDGPGIQVVNAKTWFFGTQGGNLWRTTTGGVPGIDAHGNPTPAWSQVNLYSSCSSGICSQPLQDALGFVYVASDGTFYSGGNFGIVHSTDGSNWVQISNEFSPALFDWNGSSPIVDTGTTLYVAQSTTTNTYWTAPLSAVQNYTGTAPTQLFSAMPSNSAMTSGNPIGLTYDPVNHFVYSANGAGGFWRMKTQ